MQGKLRHEPQLNLFSVRLKDITNPKHSLILLADKIDWLGIEKDFEKYYSQEGRPSVPTRTMVGLLFLKSMFNESDETLIPRWVENPYWQSFCGEQYFRYDQPCDPSDLVHFRKRIQEEGHQYLLKLSARIHGSDSQEEMVLLEQALNQISYVTDKLPKEAICDRDYRGKEKSRRYFYNHSKTITAK